MNRYSKKHKFIVFAPLRHLGMNRYSKKHKFIVFAPLQHLVTTLQHFAHLVWLGHALYGEVVVVGDEQLVEVLAEVDVEVVVKVAGVVPGFSLAPVGVLLENLCRVLSEQIVAIPRRRGDLRIRIKMLQINIINRKKM